MANSVEKEERGLYYLITVTGEFSVKTIKTVREAIEEALMVGHTKIAFNMEKATFLDSGGIGLLMNIHKKLASQQGSAYLVALPSCLKEAFQTSNLLYVMPHFPTLEKADAGIS